MKNADAPHHVSGKSIYLDDIPVRTACLHAAVVSSPVAHGKLNSLDTTGALALPGVEAVFTAADIPGENQIGGIVPDEPLLAEGEVHFMGQPLALVLAVSEALARKAAALVWADIEEWEAVTDPREAFSKGLFLTSSQTFRTGNIDAAWQACDHIFEGRADTGGQEHLYIETQGAYAYPAEQGGLRIHSSTQGPTAVQKTAARVLGVPMHLVEVDVTRLGGGFGGKEDQATAWACLAALGAHRLKKPVKIVLHRMDDMKMTGKRHPYSADFRIGLTRELKILAFQSQMYQNGGAATDLSPAILDRSLFHATNAYHIPHTESVAYSCKTHLPPNTAFRGFGGPQGMFIMEAAIALAAHELKVPARLIQERNFLAEGDAFPYGQVARNVRIRDCWRKARRQYGLEDLEQKVQDFNAAEKWQKKGLAVMPICFGISFTNQLMNQARSLVHIYTDGSLGVSTGAVEMGQGVNSKIRQVAASVFSIDPQKVKVETTNTTRVANTSPTAASSGADLNGKATENACAALLGRLKKVAAGMRGCKPEQITLVQGKVCERGEATSITWEELVRAAYMQRVCLSENGHFATRGIHFDKQTAKGHPFAYHVYGVALIEATLDCLRGTYVFDQALLVHDFGNSMSPEIDLGQVEGALVQGMGWMTMEEVRYSDKGRLLSNSLSTYKIPDIYSVPHVVECMPLGKSGPPQAILRSKAVGEPPLMYGIGAFFALQNAIKAFNPHYLPDFDAPMTPEKALLRLYQEKGQSG